MCTQYFVCSYFFGHNALTVTLSTRYEVWTQTVIWIKYKLNSAAIKPLWPVTCKQKKILSSRSKNVLFIKAKNVLLRSSLLVNISLSFKHKDYLVFRVVVSGSNVLKNPLQSGDYHYLQVCPLSITSGVLVWIFYSFFTIPVPCFVTNLENRAVLIQIVFQSNDAVWIRLTTRF